MTTKPALRPNGSERRAAVRRPPGGRRTALLAIIGLLVLAGFAVWGAAAIQSRAKETSGAGNRTLVDSAATTQVVGDVSTAVEKIFSYRSDDLAATETVAAKLLTGPAADQYNRLFGQLKGHAKGRKVALNTRVVRAGVMHLDESSAKVLVFLDQVTTEDGKKAGDTAAAQLVIDVRRADGTWKITGIRAT